MVPFERIGTVSCSHCMATMPVSPAASTQYTSVTDRHRTTAWAALMHSKARKNACDCAEKDGSTSTVVYHTVSSSAHDSHSATRLRSAEDVWRLARYHIHCSSSSTLAARLLSSRYTLIAGEVFFLIDFVFDDVFMTLTRDIYIAILSVGALFYSPVDFTDALHWI